MADAQPRLYSDSLGTEIYDVQSPIIAERSSHDGDLQFFRRLAGERGGPILEIGCGTGRVSSALAADGHETVGIDRSTAMLRQAEARRAALPPEVAARLSFVAADMTSFDLGRRFALVLAPARVFQFALTTEAQRAALRRFAAHLQPDGRLVLDLFDPRLDLVAPGSTFPPRTGEVVHPTTGNRVEYEITGEPPDPAEQLVSSSWTAREYGPSGELLRDETERLTLRWATRSEMRLLFELEGLEVVSDHGDFLGGPPAYGKEQVWVLRPAR